MAAYYNEIDPHAAQWLRNLISEGHIAPGDVDERSIVDVRPDDLRSYRQCHFFAGIGGWSYALRLAGWGDDRACWTGSCPCQPLSVAGQRQGHADQRHLWPAFHRLIAECRPSVVFGEQVASTDGREWLAAVRADLEATGYAVGAANLPACSIGAPHIRQRLWFVADHTEQRSSVSGRSSRPRLSESVAMETTCTRIRLPDNAPRQHLHASSDHTSDGQGRGRSHQSEQTGQSPKQSEDNGTLYEQSQSEEREWRSFAEGPNEMDSQHLHSKSLHLARIVHFGGGGALRSQSSRGEIWGLGSDPMADADGGDACAEGLQRGGQQRQQPQDGGTGELALSPSPRWSAQSQRDAGTDGRPPQEPGRLRDAGELDNATGAGLQEQRGLGSLPSGEGGTDAREAAERADAPTGFWTDCVWLPCSDGKARPAQPGLQCLAHGVPDRVGRLRAYGNAIVPQVAAEFIRAAME